MKLKFLFFLMAIASCTGGGENKTANDDAEEPEAAIEWDSLTCHEKFVFTKDEKKGPAFDIDISLYLPTNSTFLGKKINNALCDYIFGMGGNDAAAGLELYRDSLIKDFKSDMESIYVYDNDMSDHPDHSWEMHGSLSSDSKEGVLAYTTQTYCYQGGAHGGHMLMYVNFDASDGRTLKAHDVFKTEKMDKVKQLIECQLMADYGYETMEELRDEEGITMLGEVNVSDFNFLLLTDGVHFIYNEYEIAPYSSGAIGVTLTYKQLEGCLKQL